MDVARTALRAGASEVTMVCLEDRASMPAAKDEIEEALEENITINNSWGPRRYSQPEVRLRDCIQEVYSRT